jgi:Concanavalin A-like lectin/glucanases superfamily
MATITIGPGIALGPGITLGTGPATITDPYFSYVTLLLSGDGTNAAQNNTFTDSSTNNFSITRAGNTTQGTFSPYGSNWSNYFGGDNSINAPSNAAFSMGAGDFTFEMWINPSNWSATYAPIFIVANTGGLWIGKNGSNFAIRAYGVADQLQYGTLPTVSQWTHVVAVRSGTTLSLYFNGTRVATTTNSYNFTQATPYIATDSQASFYTGYISNLRLVKGTAVYDPTQTTLTVPTAPLTAISGTSLLTCQSNRFIDNSTNNFAITVNITAVYPSVQRFSPFSLTAAYSTSVIGGSGYFDGSGDALTVPASAQLNFGTGDFTIEVFAYRSGAGTGDRFIVDQGNGAQYLLRYNAGGTFQFYIASTLIISYTLTTWANYWSHLVVVRSGTTISMFLDGNRVSTATNSSSAGSDVVATGIGARNNAASDYFQGYISNLRIVKGVAVYNPTLTTLTIPTAPLTAIANTSLLCNMTNGGISDNAMINNLETVGNAQISTSVKKYGTGSMAFDGSTSYLSTNAATSDLYVFGSGDFTIEMWIYFNSVTAEQELYDARPASTQGAYPMLYLATNGTIRFWVSSADRITSSALSVSTWYHVALCRSGTSTRLFVNGTQAGSTYTDTTVYLNAAPTSSTSGRPWIGRNSFNQSGTLNGYIDDLRITRGYARYTSNFTPPGEMS